MTKRRAPLTFERGLTRVAGLIGWQQCGAIVGQAERTVRNWSDPDTSAGITLDAALALDVAYQAAGGEGAPMFHCYSLRLQTDTFAALCDGERIACAAAKIAKEGGEAVAAAISASRPGASDADFVLAERELEESVEASTNALAAIRAGRAAAGTIHREPS